MKIIYLGYAINKKNANNIYGASVAGNNMQVDLLEEIDAIRESDVKVFTIYPIAAFPKVKKIFHNMHKEKLFSGKYSTCIPFLNLPIIKQIMQIISLFIYVYLKCDSETVVLTFNSFPQVSIVTYLLRLNKRCKTVLLLADPPIEDRGIEHSRIYKKVKKIYFKLTEKMIKTYDGIITLNENVIKYYNIDKPYIVIEGGVPLQYKKRFSTWDGKNKNLVYTGALTEYSGIKNLIEAMEYIHDSTVVLDIYGSGPLEKVIQEIATENIRINYYGKINNDEIYKIQSGAFLLVNPRVTTDEISKLTFPSKMFEYMTSGRPVMSTRLNGFSEEFCKYIYISETERPEMLGEKINEILKMDPILIEKKAEIANYYIRIEKNWKVQARKIYNFIKDI